LQIGPITGEILPFAQGNSPEGLFNGDIVQKYRDGVTT